MAYTTQQLIAQAYYLSNILSRDLETLSNSQLEDGLFRLNGFIAMKGADEKLIPYYTEYNSVFVPNQEMYFIPNLVEIETMTFFLPGTGADNSIRFSMREMTRYDYFGTGRAEGIDALPTTWRLERCFGGSNVFVYFLPLSNYNFQIWGKFTLPTLAINQDLSLIFDNYYLEYLLYGLANYLCEYFSVVTPMGVTKQLAAIESYMRTLSPMDLTMRKLAYINQTPGIQYVDSNIARGFGPA